MLLSFVIASCVVTLMPGPSMIIVMLNAAQRGLLSGVQTALGVVVADALLLVLTLSGIGTLLYSSAMAFSILKWAGVCFLVYLGIKQLAFLPQPDERNETDHNQPVAAPRRHAFLQGLATTLLNPKIIGFFVAFFPQFLDPQQSIASQLLLLGPLFLLIVFVILCGYALFAVSVGSFIAGRRSKLAIKNASGAALIGCGVLAATMEQGS
ncbi:LysE family translocator [Marinobacterium sp. CAU 1594]|nr:LysE family translocator [Marinobacterium arenosum]